MGCTRRQSWRRLLNAFGILDFLRRKISNRGEIPMSKRLLLAAAALVALPATANAQSDWFSATQPTYQGFYIGAQGGLNWLLNNQSYIMDTGWTLGGKVGYDFVGPRVEVEGMYHSNTGSAVVAFPTGYATVSGRIEQVSVMGNVLYDFFPGAMITPYVGGGLGVGFVDANIQGCKMGPAMFAYQGIVGVGYNATPALRISLEGRYYGTTNPGAYFNNNIMALLSVSYKFGQPEVAPPPPPPPVVTPPSFMVFFDLDRSNLSQQALTTIQQAANAFKAKASARITATGHTDTSVPGNYKMRPTLRPPKE